MAEYDLKSRVKVSRALTLTDVTTATNGDIIDMQGFQSVVFSVHGHGLAGGTFDATIFESDDSGMSGATAVPSDLIIGTLPSFDAATDDNTVQTFGSIGKKRYLRVTLTPTGPSGVNNFSATVTQGNSHTVPTA